jgi:uncharacterized protein YdeI (YjbR/CyaY-like superfamily)
MDEDDPLFFPTIGKWRQWLRAHQKRRDGAWILLAKKGTKPGIVYGEALEEALCWGWIDGKIHRHDDAYYAQWFSPRRPKSVWSAINKKAVEGLIAEGRMEAPGLAAVEAAKASGRWAGSEGPVPPPRMDAATAAAIEAAGLTDAWKALPPSHRSRYLLWINDAKRPETRARRIAQLPQLVKEKRLAGFAAP